jgi:hypothetical protein
MAGRNARDIPRGRLRGQSADDSARFPETARRADTGCPRHLKNIFGPRFWS